MDIQCYRLPLTGVTASATHDESLVDVALEKKRRRRKYALVCPHAGKTFCWSEFRRSLEKMPVSQSHVVLYDNSLSTRHGARIDKLASELDSVTVVRDRHNPASIESTLDFVPIMHRCADVYEQIYSNHLPKSDYVINLEDDIGVPDGGVERLLTALDSYPEIGTVIADCNDRRVKVSEHREQSIVVNFEVVHQIGGAERSRISTQMVPTKPYGLEYVGAGHMGLWVSRREAVDASGMWMNRVRPMGHDIEYGLRLNQAGWSFAVDWSVKLKHFYRNESGKKVSV